MARRDYAKRTTSRKKTVQKKPLPGWLWLLAGLLVGLFVAFLVYLQQQGGIGAPIKRVSAPSPSVTTDTRAVTKPKATKPPSKEDEINFDFYNILPEQEVVIPDSAKARSLPPEKADYFLQVGSFKSDEDARTRMAELFLLNFTPTIQKTLVGGSRTWHRVRIGPYTDRRKLDQARRRLQENGIDFIVIKEKQG